jgi:hypothetical protein
LQRRPDDVHKSGYVWVFDKKKCATGSRVRRRKRRNRFKNGAIYAGAAGGTARVKEIGGFDPRVYGGGFSRKDRDNMGFWGIRG